MTPSARPAPAGTVYVGKSARGEAHPMFDAPLGQDEAFEVSMRHGPDRVEAWLDRTGELAPHTLGWDVRRVRLEGSTIHGGWRDAAAPEPPAQCELALLSTPSSHA